MRSRLLSEVVVPASAATLATRVGLARQKVNYHLRALEAHGLVRLAEERKWGGLTGRLLLGTAPALRASPGGPRPGAARVLRRLAGCPRPGRRRSEPGRRPAVRGLPHRPGRAGRPRGGRPRPP